MLLAAPTAVALTAPEPGAVAKPPGLELVAPFPCGVTYRVICGYSCDGYHKNTNEQLFANDHHALDLDREEAGRGQSKPVVAAAAGTVRFAGWSTGGWEGYGQLVLVELDFKQSGHTYLAAYAHLEAISVAVGEHVDARDPIGKMGRSGNQLLFYWPVPQVHFALYQDAKFSGGPYGGAAVVPEPLGGLEDIVTGSTATVACTPSSDGGPPPDATPPPDAGGDRSATKPIDAATRPIDGLPPVAGDLFTPPPTDQGCSCRAGVPPPSTGGLLALALFLAGVLLRQRQV